VVTLGIAGDSFQGVDAAQPDRQVVIAKLTHRPREPVGDLPFLADEEVLGGVAKLLPGKNQTGQHGDAAQNLAQRGARRILNVEDFALFQLHALAPRGRLPARHLPQEPDRPDPDADQQDGQWPLALDPAANGQAPIRILVNEGEHRDDEEDEADDRRGGDAHPHQPRRAILPAVVRLGCVRDGLIRRAIPA
jgi:hypothetical protein